MKSLSATIKHALFISALTVGSSSVWAQTVPLSGDIETDHFVAQVISVDAQKHTVVLGNDKGYQAPFTLPENAPLLKTLKTGDIVESDVTHSVAVAFDTSVDKSAPVASSTEGVIKAANSDDTHEAIRQLNVQLKIKKIDVKKNEVTFIGPKGHEKTISVENPDIQARLKTLKVDQSVLVTYTDTITLNVLPNGK